MMAPVQVAQVRRYPDLRLTGSDPQLEGLINCTYAGLRGGIMPVLLTIVCYGERHDHRHR
jgi:hypothetical protein